MGNILVNSDEFVAEITIDRPEVMNILDGRTLDELKAAIRDIRENEKVRVVIITGSGNKAFVAGADIKELVYLNPLEAKALSQKGQELFADLENLPQVVIAAVNGFALGGGCELALSCDLRLSSSKAKFALPEVNMGIMPGFAGTQRLPKLIGMARAKELIFEGTMLDAQEAYRIGLVNRVYEPEELMIEARLLAKKLAGKSPCALRMAKSAINVSLNADAASSLAVEANSFGMCFCTEDQKEGMTAFIEKRQAVFKGR